jgi:hypothetical protein
MVTSEKVESYKTSGLNISNQEAHRLAEELAKLTGESMTTAVTVALRERLDRVRREQSLTLAERLLVIEGLCGAPQGAFSIRRSTILSI